MWDLPTNCSLKRSTSFSFRYTIRQRITTSLLVFTELWRIEKAKDYSSIGEKTETLHLWDLQCANYRFCDFFKNKHKGKSLQLKLNSTHWEQCLRHTVMTFFELFRKYVSLRTRQSLALDNTVNTKLPSASLPLFFIQDKYLELGYRAKPTLIST